MAPRASHNFTDPPSAGEGVRAGSGGAQVQVIRAVPEEADRVRAAEAAKLLL